MFRSKFRAVGIKSLKRRKWYHEKCAYYSFLYYREILTIAFLARVFNPNILNSKILDLTNCSIL